MKRAGIINPDLCRAIARLGHTDTCVIADAGLPIPAHVPVIDLTVTLGTPRFTDVLDALLAELVIEKATYATEAQHTPAGEWITSRLPVTDTISHEDLKKHVSDASFVVRTGETTSYANVILHSGVPF